MKKKIKKIRRDKDGYEYGDFDGVSGKYLASLPIVPRPSWLPEPGEIAKMLRTAKITIVLDENTIKYFKKMAAKNKVGYQTMIRELLRTYTAAQQNGKRAA